MVELHNVGDQGLTNEISHITYRNEQKALTGYEGPTSTNGESCTAKMYDKNPCQDYKLHFFYNLGIMITRLFSISISVAKTRFKPAGGTVPVNYMDLHFYFGQKIFYMQTWWGPQFYILSSRTLT